jgi:hypothetical protein
MVGALGVAEGVGDGLAVGDAVGEALGEAVGEAVGAVVGVAVGPAPVGVGVGAGVEFGSALPAFSTTWTVISAESALIAPAGSTARTWKVYEPTEPGWLSNVVAVPAEPIFLPLR